jgi:putative acetyltransferase
MIEIRELTLDDYAQVLELWKASEGIGLSSADTRERISEYLERNPGMSFVACDGSRVIGAVLCGHDGRRGYLHHMAVAAEYRRLGIGKQLTQRSLASLRNHGIERCHLFVHDDNDAALKFWPSVGWFERTDLRMMSIELKSDPSRRR